MCRSAGTRSLGQPKKQPSDEHGKGVWGGAKVVQKTGTSSPKVGESPGISSCLPGSLLLPPQCPSSLCPIVSHCKSTLLTRGKHNDAQCVEFCFYWLNSAQFLSEQHEQLASFPSTSSWIITRYIEHSKNVTHVSCILDIPRGCATSPRPSHRGRRWIDSRRRYRGHSKLWKHRNQREPWQNLANHFSRRKYFS